MLERHLAWHRRNPDPQAGLLGHVRWADELPKTAFMLWLDRGIQFDYERVEATEVGWGMFYTANVSLKRTVLERAGGFDEKRFPFRYEDTELGHRLYQQGFRLYYDPNARAEHLHLPRLDEWHQRMVETAQAERRWVSLYPGNAPYFENLFRSAINEPRVNAGLARILVCHFPGRAPLLRGRLWRQTDLFFRQQLAPSFLAAWDESASDAC